MRYILLLLIFLCFASTSRTPRKIIFGPFFTDNGKNVDYSIAPLLIAGGLQAISGIASGIIGGGQRRRAKKALANLQYPIYDIPQEALQNKKMAQDMASTGLPGEQYAQAQQNILRQQNNAIKQANDRRAGIGLIGKIQQGTNDAMLGLDVADAKARQENKGVLMNANSQLAGYRDKAFEWNKKNKYLQDRAYYMSQMGAGNQNIMGGIDRALGAIPMFFGGGGGGLFGGSGGASGSGMPKYYNGYNQNSSYGDFETNY